MSAPVPPLRRLLLSLSSISLVLVAAGLRAQDTGGEPLNGTVHLSGGFAPDPWVVDIVPGGDTAVSDLGAGCTGFIHAEQPDLRVEYTDAGSDLGIFVYAGIDTTLVVSDPAGNWHCNDDASFLGNSNPGIVVGAPLPGTYDIWVGTYANVGTDGIGKLVLTERDSSQWSGMNLGGSGTPVMLDGIDFGDDLSTWAGDGECDDPRFTGAGAANTLLDADRFHDASDCAAAWAAGSIWLLRGDAPETGESPGGDMLSGSTTLQNAGALAAGDPAFSDGEYYDSYTFQGSAGQAVTIDLHSADFDTYLMLESPDGQREINDDDGGTAHSRIVTQLSQSGTYTVYVSSYAGGETGGYTIAVQQGAASSGEGAQAYLPNPRGDIYGLFAGIADYPGDDNDLERTDEDALRVRDALVEGAGMAAGKAWTLLDADATRANVAAALRSIGTTIGADDTLVIFYSGHGGQHARAGGADRADPDGMDESLVLYDGDLLDDELAAMLDELDAGRILLVLDSCYSGGFAKDIVSAPGRMGLFSSEEDVNSHVAYKFEAGGYLSVFFDDAVRRGFADEDDDRQLTAIELSEYIHERYRVDVRPDGSGPASARAGGPASVHQHLVVDRGGIAAGSVLFHQ